MVFEKIIALRNALEALRSLAGGATTGTKATDLPAPRQGAGGLANPTPAASPQANFLCASGATRLCNYFFKHHKLVL